MTLPWFLCRRRCTDNTIWYSLHSNMLWLFRRESNISISEILLGVLYYACAQPLFFFCLRGFVLFNVWKWESGGFGKITLRQWQFMWSYASEMWNTADEHIYDISCLFIQPIFYNIFFFLCKVGGRGATFHISFASKLTEFWRGNSLLATLHGWEWREAILILLSSQKTKTYCIYWHRERPGCWTTFRRACALTLVGAFFSKETHF